MRRLSFLEWAAVLTALGAMSSACVAKERHKVTVAYVVAPKASLPEGLQAVAVIDAGVTTAGVRQDERERKWSTIAADMIEAMLQNGSLYGSPLGVANRRETSKVLMEQDLKLAGLVDGQMASRVSKLLAVQGLVTSRITINIDVQRGTKSTIDWMSVLGGVVDQFTETHQRSASPPPQPRVYRSPRYTNDPRYYYYRDPRYVDSRYVDPRRVDPWHGHPSDPRAPQNRRPVAVKRGPIAPPAPPQPVVGQSTRTRQGYGGLTMATKDVQEISRHLTVQCVFSLIDAATGQAIVQYAPPPYQKKDEASPDFFFGSNIEESDLDPVDQFIGELVERATQKFVSLLVPVRIESAYELVGKHDSGEAGVRALRADDYAGAMNQFAKWHREYDDEPEALFAMGVTCELMGDYQQALDYYRQAAASEDADDRLPVYLDAKNRLADHISRILPPQPTVVMPEQTGSSDVATQPAHSDGSASGLPQQ
jgi:hypothetical protein